MNTLRNSFIWRLSVSVPLILAFVLALLGAPSADFHEWLHGDDVECALVHHSLSGENSGDDSSEGGSHDESDPLEPFCRAGGLSQVSFEFPIIERPEVVDSGLRHSIDFSFLRLPSLRHNRAPPASI